MRFSRAVFSIGIAACAHSPSTPATPADPPKNPEPTAAASSSPSSSPDAPAAATAASSPSTPAAASDIPAPKVVLHTGDSMVGFYAGFEKGLGPYYEAMGSKYVQDATTNAAIASFDRGEHFAKMLAAHNPDLVLITLGANDVFLPAPERVAKNVASIAKKTAGRKCFWIGPPLWKKDTGVVEVIRDNCAPCIFYDSSSLKLERRADGIHPDDKGGETWAKAFFDFYKTQPGAPSSAAAVTLPSPLKAR
jgi:acyl-CoA thioesterase-1